MVKFVGDIKLQPSKDTYGFLFKQVEETGFHKILFDLSKMNSTEIIGRAWFVSSFIPRVIKKFGTKFTPAIVNVPSKYEKVSVEIMIKGIQKLGMNISVKFTDTYAEAHEWLSGQNT